ncbi:MAG: FG-GAP repeat protein [Gammaproteobacteria bacterium]
MQSGVLKRGGHFLAIILGAGLGLGIAVPATSLAAMPGAAALPAGLRPALYRTLITQTSKSEPARPNGCSTLSNTGLKACFGAADARFSSPHAQPIALRLVAFGRAGKAAAVGTPTRALAGGQVNYRYADAGLTEWWRALPSGYEQGFTVSGKPAGSGPLKLVLHASRTPRQAGEGISWGALHYGGLVVTDARGRHLPAKIESRGARIVLDVDDNGAVYPLTVDPLVWIEQAVSAPTPSSAPGTSSTGSPQAATAPAPVTVVRAFGAAVALEGETAFVGAPFTGIASNNQQGAVYVYSEANDRTWAQSGMLIASDGAAGDQFGSRLAVAGSNLLVGAPGASVGGNSAQGAAYVFTQAGGKWSESQKLTASDGAAGDEFGGAIALSGTTALVGARYATVSGNSRQGAVYAFGEAGGGWSQTQKIVESNGAAGDLFGSAVTLDGATAFVGAPAANAGGNALAGAAYVFADSAGVWSQTQRLTASDGAAGDSFGSALALDGTMALVAAPEATVSGQINQGKVYAFNSSGGAWGQTDILVAEDGASGDQFGAALTLDSGRAFVGNGSGSGQAYIYNFAGGQWTQGNEFLGGTGYGKSVALEGPVALVGSPGGISDQSGGTAYFYGRTDLALTYTAPAEVKPKTRYTTDAILTNNAATASPPLTLVTLTPTDATIGSATATQGTCTIQLAGASCVLGQVSGNGGHAEVNATFNVSGKRGITLDNFASVANATPPVTASAAVQVPGKKQSGGGGKFGLLVLALLGLLAATVFVRRR